MTNSNSHDKDCAINKAENKYYLDIDVQEKLIDLRLRHVLTQEELARKVGTKQESISRIESRDDYLPNLRFLQKIAHAVGEEVYVTICAKQTTPCTCSKYPEGKVTRT